MFAEMKMQQMPKVCSFLSPVYRFVTRLLLCCSVCVDKPSSKEAIKTRHSIGARWQEFLYKQQSSGSWRATLSLTRSTNTHTETHLHMNMEHLCEAQSGTRVSNVHTSLKARQFPVIQTLCNSARYV